jgi:hypothetical protein
VKEKLSLESCYKLLVASLVHKPHAALITVPLRPHEIYSALQTPKYVADHSSNAIIANLRDLYYLLQVKAKQPREIARVAAKIRSSKSRL